MYLVLNKQLPNEGLSKDMRTGLDGLRLVGKFAASN